AIALFTPDEERFLLDIEKLIKREVPRGTLDLPADAVARSHRRSEERPGSSSREGREGREGGRDSRGDRGSRSSDRRSGYTSSGPRQPVDDFFLKPYEPSPSATSAEEQAPKNDSGSSAPKRQVAVLLGGSRKN
ncbi:MAG: ATP-dependent helicase, partial [Achromobacter spanius]